jgi:nitrogen fixation protein FixH
MSAATRWTVAIVGLLGGNVLAMAALAVSAQHGTAQVIPGYYDKAVHYDDAIDEAARSRALGWSAEVSVVAGTIEVLVRDRAGAMLSGARVHVDGYQRSVAADRFDVELVSAGEGTYRAALHGRRLGWHDLTIAVEHGGQRFTTRATTEAR